MAGLDDYRFYSHLKEKESPFWRKNPYGSEEDIVDTAGLIRRPSEFPSKLQPSKMESDFEKSKAQPPPSSDVPLEKYGEVSINLVSLCADNLLSHPFIVLRRQCQVNVQSRRYHLLPITLVPSVVQLHRCQGLTALWKGLGSVLTVRGVTMALEDCLSKFTPWPKEISPHSSLKMIGQHLMLKCCALALITPFYSASLVETVQSEIASERPGVLDVFKEGLTRLLSFTQPQTGRMLPVWLLVMPTVTHGILQYIVGNAVSTLSSQFLLRIHRQDQQKQGAVSKDPWTLSEASFIRLQAAFVGHLVSDVLLYPLETVLNRLHMQGTRTIIDSLDVVYEVKPILTRYEGFWDCLGTTVREEGILGLYKGFGALCLQYALYGAVLKFAHVIIREVTLLLAPPKPKPKTQDVVAPLMPAVPQRYTPISAVQAGGPSSIHSSPRHLPATSSPNLSRGSSVHSSPAHRLQEGPRRLPDLDLRTESKYGSLAQDEV